MNEFINDEAVSRTAPATSGLLKKTRQDITPTKNIKQKTLDLNFLGYI